ncbi:MULTISPECIES: hypothetical protein [unclassified Uliginosibacterium]|jgi:hypothetical protein|uniref:hypothetical protein n=1 Tax=unclassified Uliginosibacterium TaxID=2621521 RepID=UPI000C7D9EEB|nr:MULTISPECIES: hypothetical protein [unclassified Uliginosibacterium]MDO6385941.1 hypothetical protein [Uliginosibacterium sp. 31-12]PLK49950.1 hypothetical protein C0V76_05920 [Uliginosibacterium sp. TH139]
MRDDSREAERLETIAELGDLLAVLREMGQRLANESHGSAYSGVQAFNASLHQAHVQLEQIREAGKGG